MALSIFKNFAISTVATAPSPATSGTSLTVQSGDGAKFPAGIFYAVVWPTGVNPTTANAEIVSVSRSTDIFTITRAQEGSTARSIIIGDQIANVVTAKTLTDIYDTTQPLNSSLTAIALLTTQAFGLALLTMPDAATTRSTLGLGGAAVLNVGTSAGTVAAGDDSRMTNSRQCNNNFDSASTARSSLGLGNWVTKNRTISTSGPSGTPADGDEWITYTP